MSDSDGDELGQPPKDGGRGSFGISIGNVFDDTAGARKSVGNRFLEYLLTVRHALRALRRAFLMDAYQHGCELVDEETGLGGEFTFQRRWRLVNARVSQPFRG